MGSAFLFATVALAWILPRSGRVALAFSPADVQFLFPAPITRRQLIQYKLLRSLVATALGSAIVTVIFRPSSLASGWTFFVGVSILMTTMNLNLMGVSFSRDSLRKHGQAGLAREWLPLALVVVAGMVLVGTVASDWTLLSTLRRPVDILTELQRLGASGPAAVVLWPFRALVRLPLAASPAEFLRVLPAAGLLLAVNFVWVVRSDASFEEASAERAEKVAQILKRGMPVTYRARPAPFTLSLTGPPETALLWKNLILLGRFASWRMVVFGPILIALGVVLTTGTGHPAVSETIARFCVVGAALSVLMGPHIVRNDLRQDLRPAGRPQNVASAGRGSRPRGVTGARRSPVHSRLAVRGCCRRVVELCDARGRRIHGRRIGERPRRDARRARPDCGATGRAERPRGALSRVGHDRPDAEHLASRHLASAL